MLLVLHLVLRCVYSFQVYLAEFGWYFTFQNISISIYIYLYVYIIYLYIIYIYVIYFYIYNYIIYIYIYLCGSLWRECVP